MDPLEIDSSSAEQPIVTATLSGADVSSSPAGDEVGIDPVEGDFNGFADGDAEPADAFLGAISDRLAAGSADSPAASPASFLDEELVPESLSIDPSLDSNADDAGMPFEALAESDDRVGEDDSSVDSGRGGRRRPRRRRRGKLTAGADSAEDAVAEPETPEAEPLADAIVVADSVVPTGEPVSRRRGRRGGARPQPPIVENTILVPEALPAVPEPLDPPMELDVERTAAPPAVGDPPTRQDREPRRGREQGDRRPRSEAVEAPKTERPERPERAPRPPRGAPVPPVAAKAPPAEEVEFEPYVLVAESLYEDAAIAGLGDENSVQLTIVADVDAESTTEDSDGRRRRRRGRDRRPLAVDAATDRLAPVVEDSIPGEGPIILGSDKDAFADRELRYRDRDRDQSRDQSRDRDARVEREYKEILVNVDERETRIAVLENGRLVELHVEREERVVGGVYRARVANVLPGMDAAFVDIGLERNAFLYVGDILFDDPGNRGSEGDGPGRRTSRDIRIKDVARPGQELIVQVVKGPRGTKGARVSTRISIPGRYLVLMPEGEHLGVSRKVEDVKERERLRLIAEQLRPKGFGLIVRTEAEGHTDEELKSDLEYLVRTWDTIQQRNKKAHGPTVLHKDLGLILSTIRDLFGADVDQLTIDSAEEHENIIETLQQLAPELVSRVALHSDPQPIFSKCNIEEEIDRLLKRKVWLKTGGYLLIDTTEALTTIDVNTGKFVGSSSLAETILKTNLDAVDEIGRQLRLRDIGGMIVLDFIDMTASRDRAQVMRALEAAFRKDRTRTKIAHISPLGLVEMTRKRTAENVTDAMSHTCPYCQGRGRIWSPETVSIQIEREIRRRSGSEQLDAILVYANPEVAAWLIGAEGENVESLEHRIRRPVYVRARSEMHVEQFEVMSADMQEMEETLAGIHGGRVVTCAITRCEQISPPRGAGWIDGYLVDIANAVRLQGQVARVRLTDVRRSFAFGEVVPSAASVDRSEPI